MGSSLSLETDDEVQLEAELLVKGTGALPDDASHPGVAVVCHPHPLYGGDMHNSLVRRLAGAASDEGYAALLFNFRGTGGSHGNHTGGRGEVLDVKAALAKGRELAPDGRLLLMGYSFGAGIAVRFLNEGGSADALVAVALPSSADDPAYIGVPTLLVTGEMDELSPPEEGIRRAAKVGALHVIVEDCDHLFGGGMDEVAEAARGFISVECPLDVDGD